MTAWQRQLKKFGMTGQLIANNMIYYSHVNEDNRVERQLLETSGCTTVVAVAGSGERVLALLDKEDLEKFYAVDVNEEALFLLQLKLAALKALNVEEYLQFVGHLPVQKDARQQWFNQLKNKLSASCKMYWQKHISVIGKGILYTGHFEKFLQRVRPSVNFFLGKSFTPVLSGGSPHAKTFPKKKWTLLARIFSWRWIYTLWGNRDTAFIGKGSAINHIPESLDRIIYKGEAASCFMTHLIFKGHLREMKEADIPPSFQKDVLQRIKQRLISSTLEVNYHHGDILGFANSEQSSDNQSIFYSASDILSFENFSYLEQLLDKIVLPGNMIVWRAFLRNRSTMDHTAALKNKYPELKDHTSAESTLMYQVFSIQQEKEM